MIFRFLMAIAVVCSIGINAVSAQDDMMGEIRMFGGNFAPRGWKLCDGQIFSIEQNKELYEILGNRYGGDGETTFALPDLRGRVVVGAGQGEGLSKYDLGQKGGSETTTLVPGNVPQIAEEYPSYSQNPEDKERPEFKEGNSAFLSTGLEPNGNIEIRKERTPESFNNIQPFTTVNFAICVTGKVPPRAGAGVKPVGNASMGEIRMFAGDFVPAGWKLCNGDMLQVNQNSALFSLLGTNFGGDSRTTFALPDFRGRVAIHAGQGSGLADYTHGKSGGIESTTLDKSNIPSWTQSVKTLTPDSEHRDQEFKPGDAALLTTGMEKNGSIVKEEKKEAIPFSNMQPYTAINFIIAETGVFASVGIENAYVGEIRMLSCDRAPEGWLPCDGQLLPIGENTTALFSLVRTSYGGDGRAKFGLPDLRGRVAVHPGHGSGLSSYQQGQRGGAENTTLLVNSLPRTAQKLPTYSPGLNDEKRAEFESGHGAFLSTGLQPNGQIESKMGGDATAFSNMQPYLPVKFVICSNGRYPGRE